MDSVHNIVGIDLGGTRGKSTAVATLKVQTPGFAKVVSIEERAPEGPWTNDILTKRVATLDPNTTFICVSSPLTQAPCNQCLLASCPGKAACPDPDVQWLETFIREFQSQKKAHVQNSTNTQDSNHAPNPVRLEPYHVRATEVQGHFVQRVLPKGELGRSTGPIAARMRHLSKQWVTVGFQPGDNLFETSPRGVVTTLMNTDAARTYRKGTHTWKARLQILSGLHRLSFSAESGLARERSLQSDHAFDALLCAYTGLLASLVPEAPRTGLVIPSAK